MKRESGSQSTYLHIEVGCFARTINKTLKDEKELADRLPMNPDSVDLFNTLSDGKVLIYLLKYIDHSLINMTKVHQGTNLNIYKIRENLDLAFKACAKHPKIKVVGIDASSFLDKTPHLMLAIVWQVVRLLAVKSVSLKECREITRLAQEGEELSDLLKLTPEQILFRWVNFHLTNSSNTKWITNFGKDLYDSTALLLLMNQLDAEKCPLDAMKEEDDLERAV